VRSYLWRGKDNTIIAAVMQHISKEYDMVRTSVMTSAVALALVLAAGNGRAEAPKTEKKAAETVKPTAGQYRFSQQPVAEDTDKELTHGWHRGGGWGRGHGWHGYRHGGYYGYSYYRPYYYSYYSTPVYYYPSYPCYTPVYYYACQRATLGTAPDAEPRASVERAEFKMTVPASVLNHE
jgi:hypothetical protein